MFLTDFNSFVSPLLSHQNWSIIEMLSALIAFLLTIWQRANMPTAMTAYRSLSRVGVILSQVGLYFQTVIFMCIAVDGYNMYDIYDGNLLHPSHCLLILFTVSIVLRKLGAYLAYSKIFDPATRNLLTQ